MCLCVCVCVEHLHAQRMRVFSLKNDLQLSKQFMVLTPQPKYIYLPPPIEYLVMKDAITSPDLDNILIDDKTQVS